MLGGLALLKKRALRKGVWLRVLSDIERAIYNLAMKTLDAIKSEELFNIINAIVEKLRSALESPVRALLRTIGHWLAMKVSYVAYLWGHPKARRWALDDGLARYMIVCWYINVPDYYRSGLIGPHERVDEVP